MALTCPCGSTEPPKPVPLWAVPLVSVLLAGCLVWIPVVGWILLPFVIVAGIGSAVFALVTGRRFYQCPACKRLLRS